MLTKGLRLYAEELQLKVREDCAYGDVDGYLISLYQNAEALRLHVQFALFGDEQATKRFQVDEFIKPFVTPCYLEGYWINEAGVEIGFRDGFSVMKRMRELLPQLLAELKRLEVPGGAVCGQCGQPIVAEAMLMQVGKRVLRFDSDCGRALQEQMEAQVAEHRAEKKHRLRGTLGAILGALVGSIPWGIVYGVGWFVGWLGFLIGWCAKKGYELLGGKPGWPKIIAVVTSSLVMMVVSMYIGEAVSVMVILKAYEPTFMEAVVALWQALCLNAEVRDPFILNLAMGLVFMFLGLWGILKEMRQERVRTQMTLSVLE